MPSCRSAKFCYDMPGDLGHVIILTSSTQLLAYFTTWTIDGLVEKLNLMGFSLRARWKLEDFGHMAGWGPV